MTDPSITTLESNYPDHNHDPGQLADVRSKAADRLRTIPPRFTDAHVTNPQVRNWVCDVVDRAATDQGRRPVANIGRGPSLLLLGPVGTGKTFQAYGALRAFAASGVGCSWQFTTAADLYARMRPRHGVDSESEFERYAHARLLVIDDLGAAKGSEWNEEVNYRLINYRYDHELPTLITTNLIGDTLVPVLGDRVASRLYAMSPKPAFLAGTDRRRSRLQAVSQ